VGQLFRRGHLEAGDVAALGVDAVHDLLDNAVLAAGVEGLEDDQQGMLALGPQDLLQLGQAFDITLGVLSGLILVVVLAVVVGVIVDQVDLVSGLQK